MTKYDPSKNIIYKDKSTGKLINSSLIHKTKIDESISKGRTINRTIFLQ
jgi:hypothetical protein